MGNLQCLQQQIGSYGSLTVIFCLEEDSIFLPDLDGELKFETTNNSISFFLRIRDSCFRTNVLKTFDFVLVFKNVIFMHFILILVNGTCNWWHRIIRRTICFCTMTHFTLNVYFLYTSFVTEWVVGYFKYLLHDNKVIIMSKQLDYVNIYKHRAPPSSISDTKH